MLEYVALFNDKVRLDEAVFLSHSLTYFIPYG